MNLTLLSADCSSLSHNYSALLRPNFGSNISGESGTPSFGQSAPALALPGTNSLFPVRHALKGLRELQVRMKMPTYLLVLIPKVGQPCLPPPLCLSHLWLQPETQGLPLSLTSRARQSDRGFRREITHQRDCLLCGASNQLRSNNCVTKINSRLQLAAVAIELCRT